MITLEKHAIEHSFEDWKEWSGGSCPVLPSQGVQIQCRNETREHAEASFVETGIFYEWAHRMGTGDIVAYRTVKGHSYRGWTISQGRWPEPAWSATGPNYDASWEGEEDGWHDNGECVDAPTRPALLAEIDTWIEEHSA